MKNSRSIIVWFLPVFVLLGIVSAIIFLFFGIDGYRAGQVTIVVLTAVVVMTLIALVQYARQPRKKNDQAKSTSAWPRVWLMIGMSILIGITVLIFLLVAGKAYSNYQSDISSRLTTMS